MTSHSTQVGQELGEGIALGDWKAETVEQSAGADLPKHVKDGKEEPRVLDAGAGTRR